MFIIASYTGEGLTFAKIFSVLEVMTALKLNALLLILGLGLYFELKVVFSRFSNIFNIEFKTMIPIDEATKLPLKK